MTKAEAQNNNALPHDLILEGRGKLTVTGVRRMPVSYTHLRAHETD